MKFTIHVLTSLALGLILYPFIGLFPSILVFLGGWTVDIDHYIWYMFKIRKFNMFECNKFFVVDSRTNDSKHFRGSFMPFHTIEFIIIMTVLSFYLQFFLFISIGLSLHFLLDLISFAFIEKDFPILFSITYWAIKKK